MPRQARLSLLDLMTELGAHPEWLADEIGVHRTTVYAWMSGLQRPRRHRLRAIADALGLTVQDVLQAVEETERRATAGKK